MDKAFSIYLAIARYYYNALTFMLVIFQTIYTYRKKEYFKTQKIVFMFPYSQKDYVESKQNGNIYFELYQSCLDRSEVKNIQIIYFNEEYVIDDREIVNTTDNILFLGLFHEKLEFFTNYKCEKFHEKYESKNQYKILYIDLDLIHAKHQFQCAKLLTRHRNVNILAIDIEPKKFLQKYLNIYGPRPLPYCEASISIMREQNKNNHKMQKIAFFGQIYKNRKLLIEKIESTGVEIVKNPHQKKTQIEHALRPEWPTYVAENQQYEIVMNLSTNSREPSYQLKSRVMEVSIMGQKFITDAMHLMPEFIADSNIVINLLPLSTLKARAESLMNYKGMGTSEKLSKSATAYNNDFWKIIMKNILVEPIVCGNMNQGCAE